MKKILFVALAATLLAAGCQKTEIINRVGDAMTFSTEMGKLTKAEGDPTEGEINLRAQNFNVWAFYAYPDPINDIKVGDAYPEMSNLEVKWDNTNSKWYTEADYYWPGADKSLDFFAVSTDNTVTVEFTNPGDAEKTRTMTVKGYTVQHQTAEDDLMVAEFVRQHQGQNGKKVNLNFKHALSKVTFQFLTNDPAVSVVVTSLQVEGLTTNGTLTVTEMEDAVADDETRKKVSLGWTAAEALETKNFESAHDDLTLSATAQPFAEWLVMPQTLADKTVKIGYTIGTGDKAKSFTQIFALSGTANQLTAWEINQAITYTVNLSPNKIEFNPTVEDWTVIPDVNHQN